MKIKKWIRDGQYSLARKGIDTTEDLVAAVARCLEKACSYDIVGEVIFEGEDGKTYVGNVEFVISEANPDYVEEILADEKEP